MRHTMRKILLALALVPNLAAAGDFVTNPTNDLYPDLEQGVLCPFAVSNPKKCWTAAKGNAVKNALKDLRDHTSGWVNVTDFGCVGDAVHDDLPCLNVARLRAKDLRRPLYLPRPPVAYRVTDTWVVGPPPFLAEADIKYVNRAWDWRSATSYDATKYAAAAAEAPYSIIADPGTIVWGDFSSGTRKAVIYYTVSQDIHQNRAALGAGKIENLTVVGKEGIAGSPPTLAAIDNEVTALASTNHQVGLAYVLAPVNVSGYTGKELDVGLLTFDPYWTTISDSRTYHTNIGFYVNRANAATLSNLNSVDAKQWGHIVTGENVTISGGIHAEQCRQDVWIPWANGINWTGGYLENIKAGDTEYGVVFGDSTQTTDPAQVLDATVTGVKVGRVGNRSVSFFATKATISRSDLKNGGTWPTSKILDTDSAVIFDHTEPLWAVGDEGHTERASFIFSYPNLLATPAVGSIYFSKIDGPQLGSSSWTSYTPNWFSDSSPQPSIGNGTLRGRWAQIGKIVYFQIQLTVGSTTSLGTGSWGLGIPVAATDMASAGSGFAMDYGIASYAGAVEVAPNATYARVMLGTAGYAAPAVPIAWGAGDFLTLTGWYFVP